MGGGRWLVAVCLTLLLVGAVPAAGGVVADGHRVAGGDTPAAVAGTNAASAVAADGQSFARSTVEIRVFENGSARWTFRYARPLENETEVSEFRAYADRFNSEETDLYRGFVSDSRGIVRRGENATGREMNASAFARHAEVRNSLGNDIGVVSMSFRWGGFARDDGDRVVVGDVFEGGLYLGPDQTLVFHPGPDLRFVEARPEATWSNASSVSGSDSVTWTGEREFTDNRPYVVFAPPNATGGGGDGPTGTEGVTASPTPPPTTDGGPPTGLLAAAVVALLLVVGVAWVVRDGNDETGPGEPGGTATGPEGSPHDGVAGVGAGSADDAEPTDWTGDVDGAEPTDWTGNVDDAVTAEGEDARGNAGASGSLTDDALLSDEGRVVALLAEHDGRLKQTRIVEETGWSKSKVSMLLSEMADDGRIEKLRIGRENVISLVADRDGDGSGESAGDGSGDGEDGGGSGDGSDDDGQPAREE